MSEYTKPLNIVYDPRLDDPNNLENPVINKELVYQFLDKSFEYHNNGGKVEVSPELQKQFDLAFPGLSIDKKYQPNNYGWYKKKLKEKVNETDLDVDLENDASKSHVLRARQERAAHMMNLVNNVLIANDISPEKAQELSFQTVSKALSKNPNLILNNELDVKQSKEMTESLKPGIEQLKPKPSPDDNIYKDRKDLTEENSKELQQYMHNQMIMQLENFNRSNIKEMALHNEQGYQEMAYSEGMRNDANTSISLKNNIKALRGEFNAEQTNEVRRKPPTPMDELLDPYGRK